jgi:Protein of unknown function (DUF4232)
MNSLGIRHGITLTTAAAAAALLLAACSPNQPENDASPGTGSPSVSESGTATQPPASTAPSSSPADPPTATPSPSASAPAAGTALCKAATLTAAIDSTGGGAAGSVNMQLRLTNRAPAACVIKGFPGVSLVADPSGEPIGAPAKRDDAQAASDVVLQPGQTGTAALRYKQAGNYTDCTRTPAAGFRIYPPEDTSSVFLAQPMEACSNAGIELLSVGAFQAG